MYATSMHLETYLHNVDLTPPLFTGMLQTVQVEGASTLKCLKFQAFQIEANPVACVSAQRQAHL